MLRNSDILQVACERIVILNEVLSLNAQESITGLYGVNHVVLNEVLSLNAQECGSCTMMARNNTFLNEVLSLNAQELMVLRIVARLRYFPQ